MWYFKSIFSNRARYTRLHDEEQAEGTSDSSSKKPQRGSWFLGWSRASISLLAVDIILTGLLLWSLEPLITLLRRNEELFGYRHSLEIDGAQNEKYHLGQHHIPRILHQTSPSDVIPDKWVQSQQSCKEVFAGYEYKHWTDEGARDFIAAEYDWFLDTWDNYPFPIQRADSIRYFILFHFGGVYLDMDTMCNKTFPILEAGFETDTAVFEGTLPTGVTNDFMLSTARHPAFEMIISRLPAFFRLTRFWGRLQPYCAIMLTSGPLFLSLVLTEYLLQQPSLPSPKIWVVDPPEVSRYVTDLESATWHKADARALMWLGDRPWIWFSLGFVGFVFGLWVVNHLLLSARKVNSWFWPAPTEDSKHTKLS